MPAGVICGNCGQRVDLPTGFTKAKIRCTNCGYYAEIPPSQRAIEQPVDIIKPSRSENKPIVDKPIVKAKQSIDPRDHRPKFESDQPTGPALLQGTDNFDDDQPYTVPGTGTKPCPHCRGDLPLDATLCVHCGRKLKTGAKADRRFEPIYETYEEGWPLSLRIRVFGGVLAVDFLAAGWNALMGSGIESGLVIFNVFLQAFILGTFDSLIIRRSAKGKGKLTRIRRIGFYPIAPYDLAWQESHAVGVVGSHNPGIFSWLVCLYMLELGVVLGLTMNPWLMPLGLIPPAVFYWVYIRPERFDVITSDVHGGSHEIVYRTIQEDQARTVAQQVADATGLWHKKAM